MGVAFGCGAGLGDGQRRCLGSVTAAHGQGYGTLRAGSKVRLRTGGSGGQVGAERAGARAGFGIQGPDAVHVSDCWDI